MASNTMSIAMGHLIDVCRLEIYDLQNALQENLQELEDIERYYDESPKKPEIEAEIDRIREAIRIRETAIDVVSQIN